MITITVSEFYRNFNLYKDYYIKTTKTGRAPFSSEKIIKVIKYEQKTGYYSDIYYLCLENGKVYPNLKKLEDVLKEERCQSGNGQVC